MACERVKGFLRRAGVEFEARNVEEDDGAYDELIALGVRTVPATVIAGRVIKGFDVEALQAAISGADPGSANR